MRTKTIPFKCPICEGTGKTGYKQGESCNGCKGSGIVWGTEIDDQLTPAAPQPYILQPVLTTFVGDPPPWHNTITWLSSTCPNFGF